METTANHFISFQRWYAQHYNSTERLYNLTCKDNMSNKTLGYITAMLCHVTSQYDALKQHEPLIQLRISALCFSVMC